MTVAPYLFFEGNCEKALEFYRAALGAEIGLVMRYDAAPKGGPEQKDCPMPPPDKIMHAEFKLRDTTIYASDGGASGKPEFKGFALNILAKDPEDAKRLFDVLAEGGKIMMPFGPTFFSPAFGMASDKFGMNWMIYVPMPMPGQG
jgi:PhnB protein